MSHIQYTIIRSGRFYYNRRVPKHAVETWGQFIRVSLTDRPSDAAVRGGSVRLNRFLAFSKWFSALVMPLPLRASAG